jgi:hypothetical protein
MKVQQQLRFNTATSDALIGAPGLITVDTDRNELRLHDGSTPGGHRILNTAQLTAYASLAFSAVSTVAMTEDTALTTTHVGRLVNLSAIGDEWVATLPPLTDFDIGERIVLRATSADVRIAGASGDGWIYGTTEESSFEEPLPQGHIWTLVKMTTTRFLRIAVQTP